MTYRVVDLTNALARIEKAQAAAKQSAGLAQVDRDARLSSLIKSATSKAERGVQLGYIEHRVLKIVHTAYQRMARTEEPLA